MLATEKKKGHKLIIHFSLNKLEKRNSKKGIRDTIINVRAKFYDIENKTTTWKKQEKASSSINSVSWKISSRTDNEERRQPSLMSEIKQSCNKGIKRIIRAMTQLHP